ARGPAPLRARAARTRRRGVIGPASSARARPRLRAPTRGATRKPSSATPRGAARRPRARARGRRARPPGLGVRRWHGRSRARACAAPRRQGNRRKFARRPSRRGVPARASVEASRETFEVTTMIHGGNATVYVSDMDRSVRFYTETLGLKLKHRFGNHWAEVIA